VSALDQLVRLHDLDLLRQQVADAAAAARLSALGFGPADGAPLERARARLSGQLEPRWLQVYERALGRYGRGLAAVRGRVCQGCHITLPTSALPAADAPKMCESCGRILCWR
jgi:predicted  nucleic acid-binding Zn-ribbon protein